MKQDYEEVSSANSDYVFPMKNEDWRRLNLDIPAPDDQSIRERCLQRADDFGDNPEATIARAQAYFNFIKGIK